MASNQVSPLRRYGLMGPKICRKDSKGYPCKCYVENMAHVCHFCPPELPFNSSAMLSPPWNGLTAFHTQKKHESLVTLDNTPVGSQTGVQSEVIKEIYRNITTCVSKCIKYQHRIQFNHMSLQSIPYINPCHSHIPYIIPRNFDPIQKKFRSRQKPYQKRRAVFQRKSGSFQVAKQV